MAGRRSHSHPRVKAGERKRLRSQEAPDFFRKCLQRCWKDH